jgi:hypothetical protein
MSVFVYGSPLPFPPLSEIEGAAQHECAIPKRSRGSSPQPETVNRWIGRQKKIELKYEILALIDWRAESGNESKRALLAFLPFQYSRKIVNF